VSKRWLAVVAALALVAAAPIAADASTPRAARAARTQRVPLDAASPWPEMRHDSHNTGFSPIVDRYRGGRPWAFATAGSIFATPVIGADGTIYIGSADHSFYAIAPDGRLRWRLKTGGLIDAAAALSAYSRKLGSTPLTFGSADDRLYHVTTPRHGRPRVLWRFRASVPPVKGQRVDWWEGNVAVGPGGDLYAGNTGGTAYALRPDGKRVWTFTAGNSIWTTPAFTGDGSSIWGSLDFHIYRLSPSGTRAWSTAVPGYVVSSPAIGSDGTIYVGSFDSDLDALDPRTGAIRWSFATTDHIYASPALGRNRAGRTDGIYIASVDGSVYALTPGGRLRWRFDTGAPIRSSPVIGQAPGPGHHEIVYVGSSNGTLYALDAATGRRRWSYDTTPSDRFLRVRNNLNGSPALGRTGVYIGSEAGDVYYVPYDYCLHRRNPRCSTDPTSDLGASLDRIFGVDVGGNILPSRGPIATAPATVINLRLIVRGHGQTVNAAMLSPANLVHARPAFRFTTEESGDGHYLYVVPDGFLAPDTRYRLRIDGTYTDNGAHMGNFNPRGSPAGSVHQTITLQTTRPPDRLPLHVGARAVSAMTISHISVPMPPFLASVNQVGFDSYDWIASTIARTRHRVLLWVTGARRGPHGQEEVDPKSAFGFPLAGRYQGGSVILQDPNVSLTFSFGRVPLDRFELRGVLRANLSFAPNASLYAQTVCASVPNYGPELTFTGICNPKGVLAASGTFESAAYHGSANRRPAGVHASSVTLTRPTATTSGSATVTLGGARLPNPSRHVAAILLTNAATDTPVQVDYRPETSESTNAGGAIDGVHLTLPAGTRLPNHVRAYVIVDAFAISRTKVLSER
jgi:outer membrane protein assembly factor BamB